MLRTFNRALSRRCIAYVGLLVLCGASMSGCKEKSSVTNPTRDASKPTPSPQSKVTNDTDSATQDLRAVGTRVAAAIQAKDVSTLLLYESRDHRTEDEASLKDAKSSLYCYIFDSACIPDSKTRSVSEILSTARQLEIDVSVMRSPSNGQMFGLLLFYDKSRVTEAQLLSEDYRCSPQAFKEVASWHFVMSNGKWSATTILDYKTEGIC